MSENTYGLVMRFVDESESFVLGFEIGRIWQALKATPASVEFGVHMANEEQLRMIAEATPYDLIFVPCGDGHYANAQFIHREAVPVLDGAE